MGELKNARVLQSVSVTFLIVPCKKGEEGAKKGRMVVGNVKKRFFGGVGEETNPGFLGAQIIFAFVIK